MAVLQEAWQYYRRHGSITGGMAVLQKAWQYYRRHGSITGGMTVLQETWQYYRRHGSITEGMAGGGPEKLDGKAVLRGRQEIGLD
jgi:hypothetical protein